MNKNDVCVSVLVAFRNKFKKRTKFRNKSFIFYKCIIYLLVSSVVVIVVVDVVVLVVLVVVE